jgi:hypothetical protein
VWRRFDLMIAYLYISSWKGTSPGARHYYGRLKMRGIESKSIKRKLTAKEAQELNENDRHSSYKKGDMSNRFDSEQAIIDLALQSYKIYFPNAIYLVKGRSACAEPLPVLDGPLKDRLNIIFEECESLGWHRWRNHEDRMLELCNEWDALIAGDR